MAEYEFSHVSKVEKAKIVLARTALGLFIAHEFYALVIGSGDVSSRIAVVGSISLFVFAYINVLQVKNEFIQLFEPPYFSHGLEFFFAAVLLKIASWTI
jgi:hypothetical protein